MDAVAGNAYLLQVNTKSDFHAWLRWIQITAALIEVSLLLSFNSDVLNNYAYYFSASSMTNKNLSNTFPTK
jgi:hypothetical protein